MYQATLAFGSALLFAFAVHRWASDEFEREGRLSDMAARAVVAVLLLHAMLVTLSALGGVGRVELPKAPALAVGGLLALAGAALLAGALGDPRSWQQALRLRPPQRLTGGSHRVVRHPLYAGWALLLAGIAVAGRSALAAVLAGLMGVFLVRAARVEDERVRAQGAWDATRSEPPAERPAVGVPLAGGGRAPGAARAHDAP